MNFNSSVMNLNEKNGVYYLSFKKLEKYKFINHAFSTKIGGVSKNEFKSMNLGFKSGDYKENVIKNYNIFCNATGFDIESLVASNQDHNTNIRIASSEDRGIGIYKDHDIKSIDGLITDTPEVTLVTYFADCVPIYFIDPIKKVIGLAHSGWKGTVKFLGSKMIEKMQETYHCNKYDIICAIGPCVGFCCFEVDKFVYDKFYNMNNIDISKFSKKLYNEKYIIDLNGVNQQILLNIGISEANIILSDVCTKCNKDLLFSHRDMGFKRGSLCAMMSIEK